MYWDQVVKEVQNRDSIKQKFVFTNINLNKKNSCVRCTHKKLKKRKTRVYGFDSLGKGIYFSQREAEVMVHLLRGKTIGMVAGALSLSSRTIEFYVKNMKRKLRCNSKAKLIEIVLNSKFMENVDFM